jgi:putative phosphoribosyl transferase
MRTEFFQQVKIPVGYKQLSADLTIPGNASAIIVFSRAGGGGRNNALDKLVAASLQQAGFGTLLPDLLTEAECLASKEYDVELLTARLLIVTKWLLRRDLFDHYRVGYYGVTTGAAAALQASTCLEASIGAIVSLGGRPDLIDSAIPEVQSPTLLVVGSLDRYVLHMNREALDVLSCPKRLEIIQGATHLFGEGRLGEVAAISAAWFSRHLQPAQIGKHQHSNI